MQDLRQALNTTKTGYKTSEFWLHLGVQVAIWAAQWAVTSPDQHIALAGASVLALLGYTVSRTVVKS